MRNGCPAAGRRTDWRCRRRVARSLEALFPGRPDDFDRTDPGPWRTCSLSPSLSSVTSCCAATYADFVTRVRCIVEQVHWTRCSAVAPAQAGRPEGVERPAVFAQPREVDKQHGGGLFPAQQLHAHSVCPCPQSSCARGTGDGPGDGPLDGPQGISAAAFGPDGSAAGGCGAWFRGWRGACGACARRPAVWGWTR